MGKSLMKCCHKCVFIHAWPSPNHTMEGMGNSCSVDEEFSCSSWTNKEKRQDFGNKENEWEKIQGKNPAECLVCLMVIVKYCPICSCSIVHRIHMEPLRQALSFPESRNKISLPPGRLNGKHQSTQNETETLGVMANAFFSLVSLALAPS